MAEIDDLKQAVSDLQAVDAAIGDAVSSVVTEVGALEDLIAQLQSQQGGINPADVETAAQSVATVKAHLSTLVDALKAVPPVPGSAAPAQSALAEAAPVATAASSPSGTSPHDN